MQNVNGGRCAGPDCSKQPRFSLPGEKGKYCSKHRGEGMVDVLYTVSKSERANSNDSLAFAGGGRVEKVVVQDRTNENERRLTRARFDMTTIKSYYDHLFVHRVGVAFHTCLPWSLSCSPFSFPSPLCFVEPRFFFLVLPTI